jgi:hypothetical protein
MAKMCICYRELGQQIAEARFWQRTSFSQLVPEKRNLSGDADM